MCIRVLRNVLSADTSKMYKILRMKMDYEGK